MEEEKKTLSVFIEMPRSKIMALENSTKQIKQKTKQSKENGNILSHLASNNV